MKSKMINRYAIIVSICLFILIIIGIGAIQIGQAYAKIAPTATHIPEDPIISSLQNQIANTGNEENRHQLETKVAVLAYDATRQANAVAKIPEFRPTVIRQITEVELSESRRVTGITVSIPNPLSGMEFEMANAWQEKIGKGYVKVYAGAHANDLKQGMLVVVTEDPLRFMFYDTPQKNGSLKIVDVKGFQLILQTSDNQFLYFDVPGQKFISALGELVPTVTPPAIQGNEKNLKSTTTPIPAYP